MRLLRHLLALVVLPMVLLGCRGDAPSATPAPSSPAPCPVTSPNGATPPGEQPQPNQYGNGALWTDLWPAGRIVASPAQVGADGAISMKSP